MIRVANAPCSWGILEFDRTTSPATYQQVIDEISLTGYVGTERGDWGFMPTEPQTLRAEMASRSLQLIAAFVPVALVEQAAHVDGVETAVRTARLLHDAAGPDALIVLSDDNGRIPTREQNAGRITPGDGLTDEQWTTVAAGAERVASAIKNRTGLRTVFHPHCGGYVETESEIDELMERTDPALLGLCLDTGHIKYAGGDPLRVLTRYAPRIWHVHFKDCDDAVAAILGPELVDRRREREAGRGGVALVDAGVARRVVEQVETVIEWHDESRAGHSPGRGRVGEEEPHA